MIIDNFYFVGVTVPKFETDAPACVHRHGPFGFAAALQLVKATLFNGLKSFRLFATLSAASNSKAVSKSRPRK